MRQRQLLIRSNKQGCKLLIKKNEDSRKEHLKWQFIVARTHESKNRKKPVSTHGRINMGVKRKAGLVEELKVTYQVKLIKKKECQCKSKTSLSIYFQIFLGGAPTSLCHFFCQSVCHTPQELYIIMTNVHHTDP